jgi:hypothetical protein
MASGFCSAPPTQRQGLAIHFRDVWRRKMRAILRRIQRAYFRRNRCAPRKFCSAPATMRDE